MNRLSPAPFYIVMAIWMSGILYYFFSTIVPALMSGKLAIKNKQLSVNRAKLLALLVGYVSLFGLFGLLYPFQTIARFAPLCLALMIPLWVFAFSLAVTFVRLDGYLRASGTGRLILCANDRFWVWIQSDLGASK